MRERRGRRCKQLFNGLKKTRGCWILKDEVLDGALWRTRLGRGYGPVLRHYRMSEWMNEWMNEWMSTALMFVYSMDLMFFKHAEDTDTLHAYLRKFMTSFWIFLVVKTRLQENVTGKIKMHKIYHILLLKIVPFTRHLCLWIIRWSLKKQGNVLCYEENLEPFFRTIQHPLRV